MTTSIIAETDLLLLLLWHIVEKLSHRCGIPVESGVLEHLLVRIEFKAIQQMSFLIHDGVWHLANRALNRFIYANFS